MKLRALQIAPAFAAALVLLLPARASALQPLATFLEGGHAMNPDSRVAEATIHQRDAEATQQLARLLPSFTARGVYTRNEYETSATIPGFGTLIISPQNQVDGFLILDVPVVDLSQFARYDSGKLQRDLAEASKTLTLRQLDEKIIRAYYTLTATAALTRAAANSLDASQKNLDVVKERVSAGVAPNLDLQRATANLERAKGDVADAELSRVLAVRSLETLSRVTPEAATTFPEDDLHDETALPNWLRKGKDNLPELRVAETQERIADQNLKVAKYGFLPSLAAQANEHFTNATSFTGKPAYYTLTATLNYRFDLGTIATKNVAVAQKEVAVAQAEGTRRNTEDAIVEAWSRVAANIAKARAARAELVATDAAFTITQDRYVIGASTQLDVTQAQRDLFSADVARIQADLDLLQARAILRLASGDPRGAASSSAAVPAANLPDQSKP